MKLKLIQEEKLAADVTSLTLDNIFDTTYEDYVVTAHDGLGTVPNNYLRFLNSGGTEISSTVHQQHQIYGTNSAEAYSRQSSGNVFNDVWWKYSDGVNISAMIHNPYDENQQTMVSTFGNANQLFNDGSYLLNSAERVRGIKLIQYNSSTYYNIGILSVYGIEY